MAQLSKEIVKREHGNEKWLVFLLKLQRVVGHGGLFDEDLSNHIIFKQIQPGIFLHNIFDIHTFFQTVPKIATS